MNHLMSFKASGRRSPVECDDVYLFMLMCYCKQFVVLQERLPGGTTSKREDEYKDLPDLAQK